MNRIEAVFLDLGNVLAFHDDPVLFGRMAAWGGAKPEEIRTTMLTLWDGINRGTLAGDDLRREVCKAAGATVPMPPSEFFDLWNCHFRVHRELLPMVESLFGQVKVFLLSNTNEMHWRFIRPLLPIFDRFDGLVLSYELKLAKPDPAIFHHALDRAQVRPEVAIFFDDVPRFVEAACQVGIHARQFTDAATFRFQLSPFGIRV